MTGGYTRAADLARRARLYSADSISAVSFFTFGMLIGAYFLVLTPFPQIFSTYWPLLIAGLAAFTIASVIIINRFTPHGYGREDGGKWALSFSLPFLLYLIPCLFPRYSTLFTIMWYPSLGLSSLMIHLLIEREKIRRGIMRTRPFLLASLMIILTSPLVLCMSLYGQVDAALFATGLMLLIYYIAGAHSLYAALEESGN
ncbi:MAG: hypothetical protein DRK00_09340 [Thermoprotei archaeon]|nr:MAG: hypothetical protein DRK00_09340 [Thermoprotei archaeon]